MPTLTEAINALPRSVWLEIDEEALANNVRVFRDIVGADVELSAVVKADAYGHGLKQSALAFESAGADRLCVASLDEALALRSSGVMAPILVLFVAPQDGWADAATHGIDLTATDAPRTPIRGLTVQVEVETGLSRGGVAVESAAELVRRLKAADTRVTGMWTHLAMPDDAEYTRTQVARFDASVDTVRAAGLPVPRRHLAATGGVLTGVPTYEGVRIGLGMYGLVPLDLAIPDNLRPYAERLLPAMSLKARALRIERLPQGTRVSYGGRWTAERDCVIATLPVGYGDAIPRPAPWGSALVNGRRVPLVGTVAMDAVMVDVTDVAEGLGRDDEFVLLGSQGPDEIGAVDLARARNTIPWEVVTGMSQRIPRVYHAGSVLTGTRTLNGEQRFETPMVDGGTNA